MRQGKKRLLTLVTCLLVAAFVITACGGSGGGGTTTTTTPSEPATSGNTASEPAQSESSQAPQYDANGYLRINWGAEPPNLDSAKTTDTTSFQVLNAVREGLTRRQPDGSTGPGIATKWESSDNGMTWTFHLRDDAKWSDGQPVTSKDFAYAWKRAIDPRTASQYAFQFYYIVGAQAANALDPKTASDADIQAALDKVGIETPDDHTIVVHLAQPTGFWLSLTQFPTYLPERQDIVEKYGDKYATDQDKLLYNGPFTIGNWQHNAELDLYKNPNYWDAASVHLDKVLGAIITDETTSVNLYLSGQLDDMGVPSDHFQEFKSKGLINPDLAMVDSVWYIEFNLDKNNSKHLKFLGNKDIRKAMSLAIDRTGFATKVIGGGSLPAGAYTMPDIYDAAGNLFYKHWIQKPIWSPTAQPDKAKQLFQQGMQAAGLSTPPKLTMLIQNYDVAKKEAQAVAQSWGQTLGMQFNIVPQEFQTFLQTERKGDFDLTFSGWGPDYNDPDTFLNMWVCPNGLTESSPNLYSSKTNWGYNDPHWCNDQYTQLNTATTQTADNDTRMQDFVKMEQMLNEYVPIIPLYWRNVNIAQRPYVKGIVRSVTGASTDFKWAYTQGRPQS